MGQFEALQGQLRSLLGNSLLEFTVDEGIFYMDGKGTIGVCPSKAERGKYTIHYLTFEQEEAEEFLKCCPARMERWYDKLQKMKKKGVVDGYVALPAFSTTLPYRKAVELCTELGLILAGMPSEEPPHYH